ncbi:hypothetical protein [Rhodococcus sp. BE178]|uniref:hypothetical protein n=1 Tax=Rhodococcus sp. BE178 TaxID=2817737 RepID=UPI003D2383CB
MDDELGDGGAKIFDQLATPTDPYELTALIVEAGRIKDRLDQLHRLMTGEEELWMRLVPTRGDSEVLEIRIESAAQEARQLATVFRQMLADIERRRGDSGDSGEADALDF